MQPGSCHAVIFYSVLCSGSFSAECHRLGTLRGSPLMAVSLLRALCIIRRKEKGPFRTRYVSSSSRRLKIGQSCTLKNADGSLYSLPAVVCEAGSLGDFLLPISIWG